MVEPEDNTPSEGILPPTQLPHMVEPPNDAPGKYFPYDKESPSESVPMQDPFKVYMVTLNYINYVIPLFLYAIRYADVFWLCHKGFAFFFCAQLMLNATQYALGFIGISLLYKLHWYGWDKYGVPREPVFDKPTGLIGCYLTNNITVFLSAVVTYTYGYGRLKQAEQRVKVKADGADGDLCSPAFVMKCNGFVSHIGALLVLIIFICCKTPLMVEYLAVFQVSKDARLLGIMVFDMIYIVSWLLLWIGFGLKRNWDFKIRNPNARSNMLQRLGNVDGEGNWHCRCNQAIPLKDLEMDGFPGCKHETLESLMENNHNQGGGDGDEYNEMQDGDLARSNDGQYQQLKSVDPDSSSVNECQMSSENISGIVSTPKSTTNRKRHSFGSRSSPSTQKPRSLSYGGSGGNDNSSSQSHHHYHHQSILAKFKGEEEDMKSGRSPPEASPLLNQEGDRNSLDLDRC